MKTSSPETPKLRTPPAILLQGPPGGGKTTLALQFPSPYIADCESNLDGPERFLRLHRPGFTYSYDIISYKEDGTPNEQHERWNRLAKCMLEAEQSPDIKTIINDGLTMDNEFLIRSILAKASRSETTQADWIPFRSALMECVMRMKTCGKIFIMTAHEELIEEARTGKVIRYIPSVTTKIRDYFGFLFTDVWRCFSRPAPGGKANFYVQTMSDGFCDLKNSFGMPPEIELPPGKGFEKLNEWMKL